MIEVKCDYDTFKVWGNLSVPRDIYFGLGYEDRIKTFPSKIAGWLRVLNVRGNFLDVFDGEGSFQVFLDTELRSNLRTRKCPSISSGDILEIEGVFTENSRGDQIFAAQDVKNIGEIGKPLRHDPENPKLKPFIWAIRRQGEREKRIEQQVIPTEVERFLQGEDFVKVSTSTFDSVDTGLGSKPFELAGSDFKLRRDFDLPTRAYLMNLSRVYQMGFVYRDEGESPKNRNEFIIAQVFAHGNMGAGRNLALELVSQIAERYMGRKPTIRQIDFIPFILEKSGSRSISELYKVNGIDLGDELVQNGLLYGLYKEYKKGIVDPTLINGFPSIKVPFAVVDPENPGLSEDFRLIWEGKTIFHGSQEINNYPEQVAKYMSIWGNNFGQDLSEGEKRYLELLKYGMFPYWGLALSVDLLTQVVTGLDDVRDLRPTLT
ncbi:MAG: hypothetical protein UT19_C0014G0010 [Candidatus Woesebacteria bacterium GW2011_GWB1_39_10b]|uniref:Aminoacyl-tRNA synthetase class II (D/K/N) domain-containing protein n=2 Tax=Candidatus Woeseibacteriota TaxID=1752722 RepID=A0A0G0PVE8_9BACT|nr:MAG: hypothetical protein UT19_C0014G0010 [Candidatus Woesebacteria bacterium GW2011_GWB1_39_10b]OGM62304.1 MAG: hypothetical protein A3A52_00745 [Candidatus Woesebacteria bacterium RIFCSPLOWO2_01_FULL_39_14]